MEYTNTNTIPLIFLFLFLSVVISVDSASNISGIYAFGDSILDAGTNNYLPTLCRSDHEPYGVDFPNKVASGRFTDGMTPGDFLISKLGIKKVLPAYKDSTVHSGDLRTGVSFASACSGLDDLTATNVAVLSMNKQYEYFEEAVERMTKYMGHDKTVKAIENAVFFISGGTYDMLFNYYPLPLRRIIYSTVPKYHDFLLKNLHTFIKELHNMGARKVVVLGMPPVGCLPVDVTVEETLKGKIRRCVDQHNSDARAYNAKLQTRVKRWKTQMSDSKIVYADIYAPVMEMIQKPKKFGLNYTLEGCCGTGMMELGFLCGRFAITCSDPSKYLFWDAANPTQAVYKLLTQKIQDTALSTVMS